MTLSHQPKKTLRSARNHRERQFVDQLCTNFDRMLKTVWGPPAGTGRPYPAKDHAEPSLSSQERRHAAAIMRVNHAGEVCAQALYHGQRLAAKGAGLQQSLQQAALEEGDHLAWCAKRLTEQSSRTSYLNPIWYLGSLSIGYLAGRCGDRWSLGFLAETEQQVVQHLAQQLNSLPASDTKSAVILQQMQQDETEHQQGAMQAGGGLLPPLVKGLMRYVSRIMVKTAYWI